MRQGAPLAVAVELAGPPDSPRLQLTATGARPASAAKSGVTDALKRLLVNGTGPTSFYRFAECDPEVTIFARQFRGFKPPRVAHVLESLVNGFTCQQVPLTVGIELVNRLAITYGAVAGHKAALAFPQSELWPT